MGNAMKDTLILEGQLNQLPRVTCPFLSFRPLSSLTLDDLNDGFQLLHLVRVASTTVTLSRVWSQVAVWCEFTLESLVESNRIKKNNEWWKCQTSLA
jgi:hypothetical protein